MSNKAYIYLLVTPIVVIALSSLNINSIFKQNKVLISRLFYFLLTISLIYLVSNFIYDISTFIILD